VTLNHIKVKGTPKHVYVGT